MTFFNVLEYTVALFSQYTTETHTKTFAKKVELYIIIQELQCTQV